MATTTNYSWTTPDDTDLVKDGAAAIRTLGSAIDTSFAADQGDLLLGGTSDIFEPLAIGAAATVLTSDGTTASWVAPAGGSMTLISTTAITATASVDLTSIPQTYNSLFIVIDGAYENSGAAQTMTFNNTTTLYSHAYVQAANSNTVLVNTSTSSISLIGSLRFVAGSGSGNLNITIPNYASTTATKSAFWNGYGGNGATNGSGGRGAIDAITSVKITWGGTPTAQGNVYLYGVK